MAAKSETGKRRLYDPMKEIPDVCPYCGQNILKGNAYSIEHHEFAPHLPYVKSNLKRRRRWQSPP